ncbi:hypothetical protein COOONC_09392 [Cooperia oncophora]
MGHMGSNPENKSTGSNTYTPWNTRVLFAVQFISGPINPSESDGGYPGYWREGFMTVQKAVDNAIYEILTGHHIDIFNTDLMVSFMLDFSLGGVHSSYTCDRDSFGQLERQRARNGFKNLPQN